ncbi:MAG TPA: beta-1,6-N-acetylglucosaminyltransferase [Nitrosomonas sp.]|nr:beta-1,6-N-acetylglucosaminyltransferase [Nitrosomonas sp.]
MAIVKTPVYSGGTHNDAEELFGDTVKRHAYLIIAHNKRYQLEQLLSLLDDERNDVYLLLDAKGQLGSEHLVLNQSRLILLPPMQINWAGFTMIQAIMALLKASYQHGYHYYHLLSGVDLPLVSQNEVHEFLENSDAEYIDFAPENRLFAHFKIAYFHLLVDTMIYRKYLIIRIISHVLVKLQAIVGIDRTRNLHLSLFHGSAWFSITHNLVGYILRLEESINKIYHMTLGADEVFIQTYVMNSVFKEKIYNGNTGKTQNLRYIDWTRRNKNSPYSFQNSDIEELVRASKHAFFARKFDETTNREVIDMLVSRLKPQKS